MKLKALKRTLKTLLEIKEKVSENPKQKYNMLEGSQCILGFHYGCFPEVKDNIFSDFSISFLVHKNSSLKLKISELFYSEPLFRYETINDTITGEIWLKECDKVIKELEAKIETKRLKKSLKI